MAGDGRRGQKGCARTTKDELQGFVSDHTRPGATVHTDEASAYASMPEFTHEAVNHSAGEYVRGSVHTNGIESFRSLFKRGYYGTYHHMSGQHLRRYLAEFSGRNRVRKADTAEQMRVLARGLVGQVLTWDMLAGRAGCPAAA